MNKKNHISCDGMWFFLFSSMCMDLREDSIKSMTVFCHTLRIALVLLCIVACKESPPSEPGTTRLAVIVDLQAYSIDSTRVGLAWTATTATNTGYMEDHEITVRAGTQEVQTLHLPNSATSATIMGLTEGTIYTFDVVVRKNSSSPYDNSLPVSIAWSPARRFTSDKVTGFQLRLYESNSPGAMHAVQLYSDNVNGPRLLSLASAERSVMDVYLQSGQVGVLLRSGDLYAQLPAGRDTKFSDRVPQSAATLNNPQPFAPTPGSYVLDEVNIPTETVSAGLIFFVRTADDHYARILVRQTANGKLIEGTEPNRFITIEISYQAVAGIQYVRNEPLQSAGWKHTRGISEQSDFTSTSLKFQNLFTERFSQTTYASMSTLNPP